MKKILPTCLFLLSFCCFGQDLESRKDPSKLARDAFMKSSQVKQIKRGVERVAIKAVGEEAAPVIVLSRIAIDQKIAYRYERMRAEYDFKRDQISLQFRVDF